MTTRLDMYHAAWVFSHTQPLVLFLHHIPKYSLIPRVPRYRTYYVLAVLYVLASGADGSAPRMHTPRVSPD